MVIGGSYEDEAINDVEVFDLADSGSTCLKPAPFQYMSEGQVGYLRNEIPFVCGGSSEQTSCWSYKTDGNIWQQETPALRNVRTDSQASLMQPNEWYVVGGFQSDTTLPLNEVLKGDTFLSGPGTPYTATLSCMTKVNGTHLFLSGGDLQGNGRSSHIGQFYRGTNSQHFI